MVDKIEQFLTEIDPDNVSGEDLEYDADFIALEQDVQGKEEQIMGDSVIDAEPSNWPEVIKKSEQLLTKTHDLRIFINYLRALTETQGILGLSAGMYLLKNATELYWPTIHPQLDPDDDNDPTERINILMSLCDFETFLSPLQQVPLVELKGVGSFNLKDIQIANGTVAVAKTDEDDESLQLATIDGAFQACDADELIAKAHAISDTLNNLNQLESFIVEQVGINDAASFAELTGMLTVINSTFSAQVKNRDLKGSNVEIEPVDEQNSGLIENKKAEKVAVSVGINNNQDVLKALNLICDYYKKSEPSSPVPILIERAKGLVGKNFMEVMQNMAPNGVEQVEFLRGNVNNDE